MKLSLIKQYKHLRKLAEVLSRIGTAASILCLIAVWVYAMQNRSGHTGMNPYLLLMVFVPTFVFGACACFLKAAGDKLSNPGILAAIIGLLGMLSLIVIDRANILQNYETWISKGMS